MSKNIFTQDELKFIEDAAKFFEDPNVFVQGLNQLSSGMTKAHALLPNKAQVAISRAVHVSLEKAVIFSLKTIDNDLIKNSFDVSREKSSKSGYVHTLAASGLGGISGFVGLAALPVELPITTLIILRSIVDTAKQYGMDINSPEIQLECVYVFGMGGDSANDDEAKSIYYTSRLAFQEIVKEASVILGTQTAKQILTGIEYGTTNALIRFIAQVASVFEIRITKKLIAQSVPIIGAVAGVSINAFFADYFKTAAQFHFGLRRIELERGRQETQAIFEEFKARYSKNHQPKI